MAKKTPLPANAAPQASESRFKGRHRRATAFAGGGAP